MAPSDEPSTSRLVWYLPQVAVATLLVGVCPILAAWEVRNVGWIDSVLLSGLFGLALAFGASYVGGLIWSSRPGSGDLLFSELMLWGWLRRLWIERRFDSALRRLEGVDDGELDRERRGELLAELAVALEARDPYTHGHSHRVARHATTIAKRMGLSRHEVNDVRAAAMVHDIGKLSTPNEVLRKQARLNDDEFDLIKQHSARGAEMVSKLHNDRLTAIVRHHHERLDGSGYPDGIPGHQIPLGARIIAVADTFDAITSTRPYRRARSHRAAMAVLHQEAGTALDAAAVRAFENHYSGRRPLALWVAFTDVPGQLISWLGSGVGAAAGPVTRAVATAAVTGAATVTAVAGTEPRATAHSFSARGEVAASLGGEGWHGAISNATFSAARASVLAAYTQAGMLTMREQGGPASSITGAVAGAPSPALAVQDLQPVGAAQPGLPVLASDGQLAATNAVAPGASVSGVQIPQAPAGALIWSGETLGDSTRGQTATTTSTSTLTGGCETTGSADAVTSGSRSCQTDSSGSKPDTLVDTRPQNGADSGTQSTSDSPIQTPGDPQTQTPNDSQSGGTASAAGDTQTPPGATVTPAADTTTPPADTTAPPADTTAPPPDATTPPASDPTPASPDTTTSPASETTTTPADASAPADTQAATDSGQNQATTATV